MFILVSASPRTMSNGYLPAITEPVHPDALFGMDQRRFVTSMSISNLSLNPDISSNESHIPQIGMAHLTNTGILSTAGFAANSYFSQA